MGIYDSKGTIHLGDLHFGKGGMSGVRKTFSFYFSVKEFIRDLGLCNR